MNVLKNIEKFLGITINRIDKQNKDAFYQSKYEYYKLMCICTVILSVIANVFYWISDCQLFNRIAYETVLSRIFMFIPLIFYIIIAKRVKSYKIMVPISYMMIHGIMWCTIWAIYYLPIRIHANEGFIIMHIMFIAVGFCAPIKWSIICHSLLIVDIIVSYPINHYENFDLMMSLGIPVVLAVEIMLYFMENNYIDQYVTSKQLERMTLHDPLTDAYTRNKIKDICIKNTNKLIDGYNNIMIMDIDFFKHVNDTYGHDIGDTVLKRLVKIVKSCISEDDLIIRWGGEEFIVILKDSTLDKANEKAENIRKTVANSQNLICNFTISIGVTEYNKGDYNIAIKNADKALYYAKYHGRNRVVVYNDKVEDYSKNKIKEG